jgi:hypothetical protein
MRKRIVAMTLVGAACVVLAGCPDNPGAPPIDPRLSEGPPSDDARLDDPGQETREPLPVQADPGLRDPAQVQSEFESEQDRRLEESIRRPERDPLDN